MSESLRAYLVEDERDIQVFGCRRRTLLDDVLTELVDRFTDYDEQGDIAEKGQIGHAQALRELFAGRLSRQDCGPIYGWAYELYCSFVGKRLHCNPFSPCRYGWLFALDKVLAGHNVPLQFAQLVDCCPIPLPEPRELPCIGHWRFDVTKAGHQALPEAIDKVEDPVTAKALGVVAHWLQKAEGRPGSVIMGFYG